MGIALRSFAGSFRIFFHWTDNLEKGQHPQFFLCCNSSHRKCSIRDAYFYGRWLCITVPLTYFYFLFTVTLLAMSNNINHDPVDPQGQCPEAINTNLPLAFRRPQKLFQAGVHRLRSRSKTSSVSDGPGNAAASDQAPSACYRYVTRGERAKARSGRTVTYLSAMKLSKKLHKSHHRTATDVISPR